MSPPSVSVVIVSWKVKSFLENCINSIYNSVYKGIIEVIVIDNNSNDGTKEMVSRQYPKVILIENKNNVGFARANNQGFKIASGEYIYILNPDTIITPDNITILSKNLLENEQIGMVCPKVVFGDGKIQNTCARKYPSLMKALLLDTLNMQKIPVIGKKLEALIKFPYNYNKKQLIEAGVGAAMFIRKDLLYKLGLFEEEFLHGGEDNYLCYKCNKEGYKVQYTPETVIVHFTAESVKQASLRSTVNSIISNGHYFKLKSGFFTEFIYKSIIKMLYVPIRFSSYSIYFLFGKISKEIYSSQLQILYYLLHWQKIES